MSLPTRETGARLARTTPPVIVLAVCTGNICRSPAAELWLRELLGDEDASGVRVRSAGVHAVAGAGMCPEMARLVELGGASVAGFRARQLTAPMIREADLVLALSRGHRSAIVEVTPDAAARTFTLREFARLADDLGPASPAREPVGREPAGQASTPLVADRLAALVPLAHRRRSAAPSDGADDIVDPVGQGTAVAEEAADLIWTAVTTLARVVSSPAAPGHEAGGRRVRHARA